MGSNRKKNAKVCRELVEISLIVTLKILYSKVSFSAEKMDKLIQKVYSRPFRLIT